MSAFEAIKSFCQTTSIKGLPRMIKARGPSLRIMWALCVLIGSAVSLYQIISILTAYFSYETSTSIEELEGVDPIFPDVTICKNNPPPILSSETEMENPGLTFKDYLKEVEILLEGSTREEVDTLEALHSLEGYFRTTTDRYLLNNSGHANFKVQSVFRYRNGADVDCNTSTSIKPRFLTPTYPACITFKPPSFDDRTLIQSMTAIFYMDDFHPSLLVPNFGSDAEYPQTAGVVVFTHPPNTFPNLLSGLPAAPGMETIVKVIDIRRKRESDPYSDCSGATYDQLDEIADFSYTESSCRHNCTQRRAMQECHCLDPRVPTFSAQRAEYPFCGALPLHNNTIVKRSSSQRHDLLNELLCVYNNTDSRSEDCDVKCVEKCHSLTMEYHAMAAPWPHESRQLAFYNKYIRGRGYPPEFDVYGKIQDRFETDPKGSYEQLQKTSLISRNFVKVKVYFDGKSVIQYRDTPVHTPSSVSGSLGGILNLWIGISFVTVIEIAELVYNLSQSFLGRRQRPNRDEEVAQNPPQLQGEGTI